MTLFLHWQVVYLWQSYVRQELCNDTVAGSSPGEVLVIGHVAWIQAGRFKKIPVESYVIYANAVESGFCLIATTYPDCKEPRSNQPTNQPTVLYLNMDIFHV